MITNWYTLDDDRNVVPLMDWNDRAMGETRVVAQTHVGPWHVSTLFLGFDHQHEPGGPPIVFETIVFRDGVSVEECSRYSTWNEAQAGHDATVEHYIRLRTSQGAYMVMLFVLLLSGMGGMFIGILEASTVIILSSIAAMLLSLWLIMDIDAKEAQARDEGK